MQPERIPGEPDEIKYEMPLPSSDAGWKVNSQPRPTVLEPVEVDMPVDEKTVSGIQDEEGDTDE